MEITNSQVVQEWSQISREAMAAHDPEGDFGRRHLLNPVLFRLLGDVSGKRVLDAGCGQGYLCRLLAARGARVTGIEPATSQVDYAMEQEQRMPLGITYWNAEIGRQTDTDARFDAVVSNMVFMDIPAYEPAMHACINLLALDGHFVFSLQHPCFEEASTAWPGKGYVEVREYLAEYATRSRFGYQFHRPLCSYINLVLRAGCTLEEIVEPGLDPILAQEDPIHVRNVHVPSFIVIAARKRTVKDGTR